MHFLKLTHAAVVALMFSSSANAALLLSTSGSPSNTVTNYSNVGLISFDLMMNDLSGAKLNFVLEKGDLQGPLSLNAIVMNASGLAMPKFSFGLQGIHFASAGSVSTGFGPVGNVSHTASDATIAFSTGQTTDFYFGNPLGMPDSSDWFLDTSGLRAGDIFSITALVPEPATAALILPLLAGLVAMRRRKQG